VEGMCRRRYEEVGTEERDCTGSCSLIHSLKYYISRIYFNGISGKFVVMFLG
jgi:hypothetical protein